MWRQTRDVLCCAEPCCASMYMSVSQLYPPVSAHILLAHQHAQKTLHSDVQHSELWLVNGK